jgi:hypothetical protein
MLAAFTPVQALAEFSACCSLLNIPDMTTLPCVKIRIDVDAVVYRAAGNWRRRFSVPVFDVRRYTLQGETQPLALTATVD